MSDLKNWDSGGDLCRHQGENRALKRRVAELEAKYERMNRSHTDEVASRWSAEEVARVAQDRVAELEREVERLRSDNQRMTDTIETMEAREERTSQ